MDLKTRRFPRPALCCLLWWCGAAALSTRRQHQLPGETLRISWSRTLLVGVVVVQRCRACAGGARAHGRAAELALVAPCLSDAATLLVACQAASHAATRQTVACSRARNADRNCDGACGGSPTRYGKASSLWKANQPPVWC